MHALAKSPAATKLSPCVNRISISSRPSGDRAGGGGGCAGAGAGCNFAEGEATGGVDGHAGLDVGLDTGLDTGLGTDVRFEGAESVFGVGMSGVAVRGAMPAACGTSEAVRSRP